MMLPENIIICLSLLAQNGPDEGGRIPRHLWVVLILMGLSAISSWVKSRAEKKQQQEQQERKARQATERKVKEAQRPADELAKPTPPPTKVRRLPTYARGRTGQQQRTASSTHQSAPRVPQTRPVKQTPPPRPGAATPSAKTVASAGRRLSRPTAKAPTTVARPPVTTKQRTQRVQTAQPCRQTTRPAGTSPPPARPSTAAAPSKQKMRAALEARRAKLAAQKRPSAAAVSLEAEAPPETLVDVASRDALVRAVVNMEILAQPLALRESGPPMG